MNKNLRTLLYTVGILLLIFALWYFRTLVAYVRLSVVVAFIGRPIAKLLGKIKVFKKPLPRSLIAALSLFILIALLAGFTAIFAPLVAKEARTIASLDFEQTAQQFEQPIGDLERWLSQFNLSGNEMSNRDFLTLQLKNVFNFKDISNMLNNVFGTIGDAFILFFSVLFMSFFFLRDRTLFKRIISSATPDKLTPQVEAIMRNTKRLLTRYFVGICVQVAIVTVIVSVGLTLVGVENAFLIGFLAGLLNLIPYVGPIIGGIAGIIIAVSSDIQMNFVEEMLPMMGKVVLVFAVMQLVDNFFTQPVVFSNSVKAHPLEIFLVISIGGTMAGVWGMVLAIPVYTFLRIIAKEFLSEFKFVKSLTRDL